MNRKPCFRTTPRRSVGCECPPHPAATALHTRGAAHPAPDHQPPTTALRAGSDNLHSHQDRRTT
ncbi:hypothetical protein GCM10022295_52070 [Streptomyces osmaniensis]|uniref:Uncharacterized protein n=1 Tax=Streptomyces osmaniensis TaxID=593134 RepID=A0ABP6X9G2_9ACTN